ncbi:hypothetical protein [Streptococcus anginosus]|uniref:hypothetical protein n=1 Tax=Streptococcus anginosus TaxID=1328 RepID=UPI0022E6ED4F|nr:hypothetical protein [Streptococcus anginosus]
MKNKLTLLEYIGYLSGEAFIFLLLFKFIIDLVINLNPEAILRNMLLVSVIVLGIIYFIIKITSQKLSEKPLFSMLPISYLLGFYLIQFLMVLANSVSNVDYSKQLVLLTLFFITVSVIDKVIDHYFKEK